MAKVRIAARRRRTGFTLIEMMFAVLLVGFSITGIMLLMGSGTQVNAYGSSLSTAVLLAGEAQALTDGVDFYALGDFDGDVFSPTDANGAPIGSLERYEQTLSVTYIDPYDFTAYGGADPVMARLVAMVSYDGRQLSQITWLRSR